MAIDIDKIREKLKKKSTKEIIIDLAIEFKLMNGTLATTTERSKSNERKFNKVLISIGIGFAVMLIGVGGFFIQRFIEGLI